VFPAGQEGRGIGLTDKVRAYAALQSSAALDTYTANRALGLPEDARTYDAVRPILAHLGLLMVPGRVLVLTANGAKVGALGDAVHSVQPLDAPSTPHSARYCTTKARRHASVQTDDAKV
jgi:GTP cyclohydrolase II